MASRRRLLHSIFEAKLNVRYNEPDGADQAWSWKALELCFLQPSPDGPGGDEEDTMSSTARQRWEDAVEFHAFFTGNWRVELEPGGEMDHHCKIDCLCSSIEGGPKERGHRVLDRVIYSGAFQNIALQKWCKFQKPYKQISLSVLFYRIGAHAWKGLSDKWANKDADKALVDEVIPGVRGDHDTMGTAAPTEDMAKKITKARMGKGDTLFAAVDTRTKMTELLLFHVYTKHQSLDCISGACHVAPFGPAAKSMIQCKWQSIQQCFDAPRINQSLTQSNNP